MLIQEWGSQNGIVIVYVGDVKRPVTVDRLILGAVKVADY